MAMKKCCIESCNSCSTRCEDVGVTYHKFPKDLSIRDTWKEVTHLSDDVIDMPSYVCSRHFCKSDFQSFEKSKYLLKTDAVPSIFPWTANIQTNVEMEAEKEAHSPENIQLDADDKELISLNDSKESEGENIEAIKKFIEEQEKEILELEAEVKPSTSKPAADIETGIKTETAVVKKEEHEYDENKGIKLEEHADETISVASSVIDIILSESEARLAKKNVSQNSPKPNLKPAEKANSTMALSVGSKVEAKDFSELWYPAHIVEVDYDEMEVLVHYDNVSNKHDEWINVSSPRLRPFGQKTEKPPAVAGPSSETPVIKEETKIEEKAKIEFKVGDRCLARWRDNRRFVATVHAELENGEYEVVFDDGFHWVCNVSRLSKMRDSKRDTKSLPFPDQTVVPSGSLTPMAPCGPLNPGPYHTHLFDPARDYLGTKSERREKKRKLNIKEIFNIGQKKKREVTPQKEKVKKKTVHKVVVEPSAVKKEVKAEVPDAVASIIGSVKSETESPVPDADIRVEPEKVEVTVVDPNEADKTEDDDDDDVDVSTGMEVEVSEVTLDVSVDDNDDNNESLTDEVMDKISDTINKLEDDLIKTGSPRPDPSEPQPETGQYSKKEKKKSTKIKKTKKLRLLQEKKVKLEVARAKSELEAMKNQVAEMKKQIGLKTEELYKSREKKQVGQAVLLPGEWCCKWENGQPVGTVSEIECEVKDGNDKAVLPRRSVQVEDERLPPGWSKHMVRRSQGHSAGKWDVVLVSPDNKRLHTKTDMQKYIESLNDESLKSYEHALLDFGMHRKLARRLGWDSTTNEPSPLPLGTLSSTSPIVKHRKLSLKRRGESIKDRKLSKKKRKMNSGFRHDMQLSSPNAPSDPSTPGDAVFEAAPLEDGYVYVGSLQVQIIENLLRCPAEGCFKNFRNNTLLQMHIKHYHRELRKMMGATPKVSDLAHARAEVESETKLKETEQRVPKLKISKKRFEEPKTEPKEPIEPPVELPTTPVKSEPEKVPRSQDSPRLRKALAGKPSKGLKVLLPVRKSEEEEIVVDKDTEDTKLELDAVVSVTPMELEPLDFESAISTHTVTRPIEKRKKGEKRKKTFATISKVKPYSEDEEWCTNSDFETRFSFPRSGSPDSKMDKSVDTPTMPVSSESTEDQKEPNVYMYTESGEKVKIVHMKREEIINCHCGFREEDGLMIQCELCLCWQHALCHNIQKEAEVPEKYTCSICLNPRRGRRSQRFLHDQDRLYEGLLPGARPCDHLKRSHELTGNLLRIEDALHALRVKYYVANKKDHPKLYLWAKDWEHDASFGQEKLNSDYVDLSVMISAIGKENMPVKSDDMNNMSLSALGTPTSEDPDSDRFSQRDTSQLGSQALLSGLLSSPGGASLDLPISTSDLERLAKTVQEAELSRVKVSAPQPEAAIENSACRERLLRHIQRCQVLIDARLDSIEAQVAELESQDPSFEDDETADYFPRTKQTVQMLLRDLDAMEDLGVIT